MTCNDRPTLPGTCVGTLNVRSVVAYSVFSLINQANRYGYVHPDVAEHLRVYANTSG